MKFNTLWDLISHIYLTRNVPCNLVLQYLSYLILKRHVPLPWSTRTSKNCHRGAAFIFSKVPFYISHTSVFNVLSYKFPKIICILFSLFCNRIISLKWFWNLAKFFYVQFVSRKEKLQNVLQLSLWIRNSLRICFLPGNSSSKIKFQQKGNRLFKQWNITFFNVSQNNFYFFFYIYILIWKLFFAIHKLKAMRCVTSLFCLHRRVLPCLLYSISNKCIAFLAQD